MIERFLDGIDNNISELAQSSTNENEFISAIDEAVLLLDNQLKNISSHDSIDSFIIMAIETMKSKLNASRNKYISLIGKGEQV